MRPCRDIKRHAANVPPLAEYSHSAIDRRRTVRRVVEGMGHRGFSDAAIAQGIDMATVLVLGTLSQRVREGLLCSRWPRHLEVFIELSYCSQRCRHE